MSPSVSISTSRTANPFRQQIGFFDGVNDSEIMEIKETIEFSDTPDNLFIINYSLLVTK